MSRNIGVSGVTKFFTLENDEDRLKTVLGSDDCSTHYSYSATAAIDAGDPNFQLYKSGMVDRLLMSGSVIGRSKDHGVEVAAF